MYSFEPALAHVLTENLHHATIGGQVGVGVFVDRTGRLGRTWPGTPRGNENCLFCVFAGWVVGGP